MGTAETVALGDGRHSRRAAPWFRSPDVAVPAALLLAIAFACFVVPQLYGVPPVGGKPQDSYLPAFSPGHALGTDMNGNDTLSRMLHGGRTSLEIALAVNLIGLSLGGLCGALVAYLGGTAESVVMRGFDVLIAFPALVLVLVIAQTLGPSEINTICALSFFSVPAFARVARAAALRLRDQPFMVVARLYGTSTGRVLLRHIAPSVLPQLLTFALLGSGIVMVIEGALSFLGLGIPAPKPTWGNLIYQGQQALLVAPRLVLLPSAFLFATVLSLNLLGEALRGRWNTQ